VADVTIDELRSRRLALEARLASADASRELDALKAEIGALFKVVEKRLAEMNALRDDVMQLVEKWKGVKDAVPSLAPEFTSERPVVYADHIGASTFIEKGWSKISLGEYAGAEEALLKALQLSPNNPQAESLRGWALMLQNKFDEALLNFQKVLVREPQNALARINVGYICLKKHIFGEAIEHLSRAIRLDNDKKPQLETQIRLFRDGQPVYVSRGASVTGEQLQKSKRLFLKGQFQLKQISAGDYTLQIVVQDNQRYDKYRIATQAMDFQVRD